MTTTTVTATTTAAAVTATTTSATVTATTTPATLPPATAAAPGGLFACDSAWRTASLASMARKGMCLDDTTFSACPGEMPGTWPNAGAERVTSLRIFKPWHPDWGGEFIRMRAWRLLAAWVRSNGARVLVGTEVTCDAQRDDDMWLWALELMRLLGRRHVMGVAVGNEMDLFRDA